MAPDTNHSGVASGGGTAAFGTFNLRSLDKKHVYGLVFGCSGSGKSYLTKDLLKQLHSGGYWEEFYLCSPTENLSHSFAMFDKTKIQEAFSEEWLQNFITERVQAVRDKKKLKPAMLVYDDCAADAKIRHSPALNKLFISGRHLKVGCFLLLQNVNAGDSVPPALRNNATLIVCARPRKQKDRQYIVREWFSMGSEKEGEEVLLQLTAGDHNFAVCNLQKFATATRLEDFITQYHASEVEKSFRLSSKGGGGEVVRKKADERLHKMSFI
jgi:hypothetical protein